MKVAIISTMNAVDWGGSEDLWLDLAKYLHQEEYECSIHKKMNINHPKYREIACLNVNLNFHQMYYFWISKFIRIVTNKISKNPITVQMKVTQLLSLINPYNKYFKSNFDVILINQGRTYDILEDIFLMDSIFNHTKNNLFLICHWNTDYSRPSYFPYKWHQKIFKKFNQVFFVSKRNLQTTERQLAIKLSNKKIIKNPINRVNNNYISFPKVKDNYHLACVALLSSINKGQDVLLEVLSQEKWKNRNFILHLYGHGSDKEYYKELVRLYSLKDKVIFEGYQNIDAIWSKCHLLIMPSISEGLPLALMEAMSAGRAAIVTHIAGMPEVVQEGINGFVAEAPKDTFLDAAFERAWNHRKNWKIMGLKARKIALTYMETFAGKTLFNKIISSL